MKNTNNGKRIIVLLLIILLLLGLIGCGFYIYIVTDLFKTPEQLFKKYMLINFIELTQIEIKPFDEIEKRTENELTECNLKLGIDAPKLDIEETKKMDVNLSLKTDLPNKNEELEVLINKEDEEFFKGYMNVSNETFGISIPDLYDKYVAVENRDLKKIAKTLELPEEYIETIPDKFPSALTAEEKEKISKLSSKYLTQIIEQIEENDYVVEKNININVNSEELIANKYSLSINTKKLYTHLTNAISELFEDPEFLELTKDRIEKEKFEEIKSKYKEFLKANPITDEAENQEVKISVYESGGKTVKTEIRTNEQELYFSIINNEIESLITISNVMPKAEDVFIGTTTTVTIRNKNLNDGGELTYERLISYDKNDIAKEQAEYGEDFGINYSEIYEDEKIKLIINTKKTNEDTYAGTITFEGEKIEEIKEILDISFKFKFGKASITTLSKDNSVIINDYTMKDFEKLIDIVISKLKLLQFVIEELGINLVSLSLKKPNSLIPMIFANYMSEDPNDNEMQYSEDFETDENIYDSDNIMEDYSNINFSEDTSNDNHLNPTVTDNTDMLGGMVDFVITEALNSCLIKYKNEITYNNADANLGDFLNLDKIQEFCGAEYSLELPDSTTIKCTTSKDGIDYIFYALMDIDGDSLSVREVEVLTEEEYLNR